MSIYQGLHCLPFCLHLFGHKPHCSNFRIISANSVEEQSDQGLHCLPLCLHHLDALL